MEFRPGPVEGVEVNPAFWKGKRVLLTGHTGFKGSWMALWLQELAAKVVGFALPPPTDPSLYDLANIGNGMKSVVGDLCDAAQFAAVVREQRPEIIVHMAAQSLVRRSYADPVGTYATNVMGTVHVLEAARQSADVRVVLVITSDKCYHNAGSARGYREDDPMGGHDPYSSSKGCAELVTAAYRDSFFANGETAVASARAGNVIGGGDFAEDRLVPDAMRAFLAGRQVRIRNPKAVRPWQHVLEPLSGYLALMEKLWDEPATYAESWNFGPEDRDAVPVSQIISRLAQLWGDPASWVADSAPHPPEAQMLRLDSSKARARLDWRSRWDLEHALRATVDWYRAHRDRGDLRRTALDQICAYQAMQVATGSDR